MESMGPAQLEKKEEKNRNATVRKTERKITGMKTLVFVFGLLLGEKCLTKSNAANKHPKEIRLVSFEANIKPANRPLNKIQINFPDNKYLYKLMIKQKVNAARRDS